MKLWTLLLGLFLWTCPSFSQPNDYEFIDYTYQEYIKSVKFSVSGLDLSYPILDAESGNQLKLAFDDLEYEISNYFYKIVHCNADWTPSSLSDLEYIDGFSEARIQNATYSFNTLIGYTHYDLYLPNRDTRFTKSGNYLLIVYNEDDDELILTRRFMVVEPLLKISGDINAPVNVSKIRTHQEVDFRVNFEGVRLRNPQKEIRATVLQNGRWDNAVTDIPPMFVRVNELIYNYQGRIVFPGGNEYRFFDIRDLRVRNNSVLNIDRFDNYYDVTLYNDRKRRNDPYLFREDLNGNFVIDHRQNRQPDTQNDYAQVLFSLYSPAEYEGEVYIFGAFTDWQLKEDFKMIYNPNVSAYVQKVELKEGFYNYAYAVEGKEKDAEPSIQDTEGSWFSTENEYLILMYYRPFGARFDQLIGTYLLAFQ
ncbi:MAG: type IX secretion system plug protein domain-containing protein [Bacteroidota bacterium]